jgi:hypothetical protein
MLGDEVMVVHIVMESMMMKAAKTVFTMVTTLWFAKSSVLLGLDIFSYIRRLAKGLVERATRARLSYTTWPRGGPAWCTIFCALWVPSSPSYAQSPPFP